MQQLTLFPTYRKGDRVVCEGEPARFIAAELDYPGFPLAVIELDKLGLDKNGVRCLKTRWTVSMWSLGYEKRD